MHASLVHLDGVVEVVLHARRRCRTGRTSWPSVCSRWNPTSEDIRATLSETETGPDRDRRSGPPARHDASLRRRERRLATSSRDRTRPVHASDRELSGRSRSQRRSRRTPICARRICRDVPASDRRSSVRHDPSREAGDRWSTILRDAGLSTCWPSDAVETLADGFQFTEGPLWLPRRLAPVPGHQGRADLPARRPTARVDGAPRADRRGQRPDLRRRRPDHLLRAERPPGLADEPRRHRASRRSSRPGRASG